MQIQISKSIQKCLCTNQKYEEIERDSRKLSPKFYKEERERAERERSCEM
jgi:hypothetical protein